MNFGKVLLIFMLCLFGLIGCTANETEPEKQAVTENNAEESVEKKQNNKKISASNLPDMTNWSEVNSYIGNIDGDEENEEIILMTSAERDVKDEIVWNDGQNWVLYVNDDAQSYVLFDKYIQAGNVYFEVLDYYNDDGVEVKINTIISTGAGFSVNSYSFNNKEKVFEEEVVYDTSLITKGGTNRKFSSVPEIK